MKNTLVALALGVALLAPALPAFAETTQVQGSMIGQLQRGSQGDKVKLLQAFLASDPSIFPEGVISGFFGPLTAKAVARFQKKHGLEAVGNVGPKTLRELDNDLASSTALGLEDKDDHGGKRPCAIVPPGHLIAPGWLKKDGNTVVVPPCQTLPPGIQKKLDGDFRQGSSTKGNDDGHHGTTSDVTAPIISNVMVSNLASTSARVLWNTNELSTSKVYLSTTSPINLSTALTFSGDTLLTLHGVNLTGLSTSTAYYFVVSSKDSSNNISTSTQSSFVTLSGL